MNSRFIMRSKLMLFLVIVLTLEFVFNGWVGIAIQTNKLVTLPKLNLDQASDVSVYKVKMNASSFNIRNPILVGETLKNLETQLASEQQEALNAEISSANDDNPIREIFIDNFRLRLIATISNNGNEAAIIEASEKTGEPQMLEVGLNQRVLNSFQIEAIGKVSITLSPASIEDSVADFKQVILHLYKPEAQEKTVIPSQHLVSQ